MAFNRVTFDRALSGAATPSASTPRFARKTGLSRRERALKRMLDIAIACIALLLVLPALLVIVLALALEAPGRILTREKRVGEGGRIFELVQFRIATDGRVSRVGALLQQLHLDTLPVLLNILRGEMSFVGPVPEPPQVVQHYEAWQRERLLVPQGVIGWQPRERGVVSRSVNIQRDVYYIRNYSLWLDIRIMAMTIGALFDHRGTV